MGTTAVQTRMVVIKAMAMDRETAVQAEMVVVGPGMETTMATETGTGTVMEQETQVPEHPAAGQEPLAVV